MKSPFLHDEKIVLILKVKLILERWNFFERWIGTVYNSFSQTEDEHKTNLFSLDAQAEALLSNFLM